MQRRQKTHLGYLLVLEYLEATSCDIDQAIDAIAKTQRITESQKKVFREWFANDTANFGIGADYHTIPRAASITVHPLDNETFQIVIRSAVDRPLLLKCDRSNAVILASETLAAVQNPAITRRIHELRPIRFSEGHARAIQAGGAALPDDEAMEPVSAG